MRTVIWGVAFALVAAIQSNPIMAQGDKPVPMSGTVLDGVNRPVADAYVVLLRHTGRPPDSDNAEIVAHGRTDVDGHFSFGDVAINAHLNFPLETAIWFEYGVNKQGKLMRVDFVDYTAPRSNAIVTSVAAEVHVH